MRELLIWATAVLLLLAALYTVAVRREVYAEARRIGILEQRVRELKRRNDNRELLRERLASPATLRARTEEMGLAPGSATR